MYNITFLNNSAVIYGDNIASVPKYLLEITEDKLNLTSFKGQSYLTNSTGTQGVMVDVQSGGNISLYFTVIDKYGTVVGTDDSSSVSIV